MKPYRIQFSRIRSAWLRRSLMLAAFGPMVAVNWCFILWAAAKHIVALPLWMLIKAIEAPVKLLNEGFIDAWNGIGPGGGDVDAGADHA